MRVRCGAGRARRNAAVPLLEPASVGAEGPIRTEVLKLRPDVKKCREEERRKEEGLRVEGQGGKWRNLTITSSRLQPEQVFFLLLPSALRGLREGWMEGGKKLEEHGGEVGTTGQRKHVTRWQDGDLQVIARFCRTRDSAPPILLSE